MCLADFLSLRSRFVANRKFYKNFCLVGLMLGHNENPYGANSRSGSPWKIFQFNPNGNNNIEKFLIKLSASNLMK